MAKDDFYFAFEAKYRGSRELIRNRQKVYIPFIDHLKSVYGDCSAFDIGCGHGEWLELMAENNVHAQGADLDDDMVSACQEQGVDVKKKMRLQLCRHCLMKALAFLRVFILQSIFHSIFKKKLYGKQSAF